MNRNLLIDGIVRQIMVTIAQLATTGGVRTPLAHLANEVFLELAHELEEQGLGRKVIADMFGMTLRAYHAKVRRLAESRTMRGQSLWTALLDHIGRHQPVTRVGIEQRFARDDAASVAGILNDLVKSALVFRSGDGPQTVYRLATPEDFTASDSSAAVDSFVWLELHRGGPMSRADVRAALPAIDDDELSASLLRLEETHRIARSVRGGVEEYASASFIIPLEESAGWEAAVLDHFQTVTATIAAKARGDRRARLNDEIGGSTFHFDLCDDHPLAGEVRATFTRVRAELQALRARVDEQTRQQGLEPDHRLSLYLGQIVIREENDQ